MAMLNVEKREVVGKKVKDFRAEGKVPAVMFGPKFESTSVLIDDKEFRQVFEEAGFSALVDVETPEGKKEKVVFKEIQQHPVNDQLIHVSMYVIDAETPITADIPLEFTGVSQAEKDGEGFVAYGLSNVGVRCLPADLPSSFTVDLSKLETITDTILVSDIELPENVEFDTKTDEGAVVASIATAQKVEDVLEEIEGDDETEIIGDEGEVSEAEGEEGSEEGSEAKE